MVTKERILSAYDRIRPFIHRTPLIHSRSFSRMSGSEVFIKAENLQKTGSFKVRGVFNKIMGLKGQPVITASTGNHAQALAFAAATLGVKAKIIMPVTVPIVKEEATRAYGAEVVLHGSNLQEAMQYALSQEGYVFVHPFDDEEVIAGQGTIGLEIMEDLEGIGTILVPVGGGGLLAGMASIIKEGSTGTELIGVQTETAPSAHLSFREHRLLSAPVKPTLADGIAVGKVGKTTMEILAHQVDDILLVHEEQIAVAVLLFMERTKLVVEGAGAAPLAALLADPDRFKGRRAVLVASGGNIDPAVIDRIVRKGLVTAGRIALFHVVVDDNPGSLHDLTGIIAAHRANILDVSHNRLTEDLPLGKTRVAFTVEARRREDLGRILTDMRTAGYIVVEGGRP